MKIVYIAHPIGGKVQENLADLRRIIRKINMTEPNVVPFCPYYADVVSLDDNIPEERARGIANDMTFFERKIPDELWLTGPKVSFGMHMEELAARKAGIPIIDLTNQL